MKIDSKNKHQKKCPDNYETVLTLWFYSKFHTCKHNSFKGNRIKALGSFKWQWRVLTIKFLSDTKTRGVISEGIQWGNNVTGHLQVSVYLYFSTLSKFNDIVFPSLLMVREGSFLSSIFNCCFTPCLVVLKHQSVMIFLQATACLINKNNEVTTKWFSIGCHLPNFNLSH